MRRFESGCVVIFPDSPVRTTALCPLFSAFSSQIPSNKADSVGGSSCSVHPQNRPGRLRKPGSSSPPHLGTRPVRAAPIPFAPTSRTSSPPPLTPAAARRVTGDPQRFPHIASENPDVNVSELLGEWRKGGCHGVSALLRGGALARPDVQDQRQPTRPQPLSLPSQALVAGALALAAGGKPALLFPSLRRVRSFALLLPLAGSFVPVAKGTQVLPVLLGSFSHSPAARGVGEAPGPVTWSPPRGGEAGSARAGASWTG